MKWVALLVVTACIGSGCVASNSDAGGSNTLPPVASTVGDDSPDSTGVPTTARSVPTSAVPESRVIVGDRLRFDSLADLVRWSTLVVRGTVEELQPGVKLGIASNAWVGTPTRVGVAEVLAGDASRLVGDEMIALQAGGTAGSLTDEVEGEPVVGVGTDVLLFASVPSGLPGDPSDYSTVIAAPVDASGRIINEPGRWWSGAAPFLVGASASEIAELARSMATATTTP